MAKTKYEDRTLAVSLTNIKTYLRITHTNDDTIITNMIRAAMAYVENYIDTTFTEDCDAGDISDFFGNEEMSVKWTASGETSEIDHPGSMVIDSAGDDPESMAGVWQRLTGDFDVRASIKLVGTVGLSTGVMIVAKGDDDNAVSARYQQNAAGNYVFSRNDEVEGTLGENTSASTEVTEVYLRLVRAGGRFTVYGKQKNTDAWTTVTASATELITNGPIELWLSVYHGASAIEGWFDWIVENSEYADFPLPYCLGGSAGGSGQLLWGECADPICCEPVWIHPCTLETQIIPFPVQQGIMEIVRRMYDNRGGIDEERTAGWEVIWRDLHASGALLWMEAYRRVGL